MLVDQTHESVVVGERAVVKWAVRAEPTPAPIVMAHLNATGFTSMPQPLGCVTWSHGGDELLLASVVAFLPGASDGWSWAVHAAGDFIAHGGSLDSSVADFAVVGETVAEMHVALATPSRVITDPEGRAVGEEIQEWVTLAHDLLRQALDAVDGPEGDRLVAAAPRIASTFDAMRDIAETVTIPVHGDLHIGQVLRWDHGLAVSDFDGNPVLPVAARLSPQPAARDVAGMLQSIDHVGRVVLRRMEGADSARVEVWNAEAQRQFLRAYRDRLDHHDRADLLDDRLLLPMRAEQECREFLYAVRHLPRWRYVPDQALQSLFPQV
jgi:maltokinase